MDARPGSRLPLIASLTAAFGREIDRLDPSASIPWQTMPTVRSMVAHVGGVQRWVTEVLRTRGPVPQPQRVPTPATRAWYDEGRAAFLEELTAVSGDDPCWVLGGGRGTAEFWRRRMVYEHAKHLIDLRASGGGTWTAAPELVAADYADGIDELLTEFLPRSRPSLEPLPGALLLAAVDTERSWLLDRQWELETDPSINAAEGGTRIRARAGDLALLLWERADPLGDPARFRIDVSTATAAALTAASMHPW